MKFPLSWLKEYLPTDLSPKEIAGILTELGLEAGFFEDPQTQEVTFELSLTPNLGHCANIRGVARELAAVVQTPILPLKFVLSEDKSLEINDFITVDVQDTKSCPLYACRLIKDVQVTDSPTWLKKRLETCGLRTVNNVVDITNLVMHELGQPLHAFDYGKIRNHKIIVRKAQLNEQIQGLDGVDYYPSEETLLICDSEKPIAIAGVLGGRETEVTETTSTILLEAAYFEPKEIRRSSKRLNLATDASRRFERGVDPNGVIEALDRATALIAEVSGGKIAHGVCTAGQARFFSPSVCCRLSRLNALLGTQLAMNEVETLLKRMDLKIQSTHQEEVCVKVPTYRHDIRAEIDLIEEVARLYGYRNIPRPNQIRYQKGTLSDSAAYIFEKQMRTLLIANGLQEFITCNLISPSQIELLSKDVSPSRSVIKLLNPQSIDQSIMRPSLLPGLVTLVRFNEDHGIKTISGFEIGKIHFKTKDSYIEPPVASIVLSGLSFPEQWNRRSELYDFFDLKGIVEDVLKALKIQGASFGPCRTTDFHPGRAASVIVNDHEIGVLGELHPNLLQKANLKHPVFFAEILLEDLHRAVPNEIKMQALPIFPGSTADWTVPLHAQFSVQRLLKEIYAAKSSLLSSAFLISVYQDENLGSDWKKVTVRFIFRDTTRTLTSQEVDREYQRITDHVLDNLKPSP